MTADIDEVDAIHTYFGLTYANYLVLHRSLLQSMPDEWQAELVRLLHQMNAAFRHVDQTESYEVIPGEQAIVDELTDEMRKKLGITSSLDDMPEDKYEEWLNGDDNEVFYEDRNGVSLDAHARVHVPGEELVPHYNRGRTYIEPNMEAYQAERVGGESGVQ